jgi:primase-polymerase (primpol)-like protein
MIATRTCERCHQPINWAVRGDAHFCSVRCRVAAHRARHASDCPVPSVLRDLDRWVRHENKRPVTTHGCNASVTDPSCWASFAAASASTVGDGAGFVLAGDGIVCLDLDHCITGKAVAPWAEAILSRLPHTYIEVSPSGHGLHVWGLGALPAGRVVSVNGGRVECYGQGRYLTVTGRRFRRAPATLADLTTFIASL